MSRFKSLSVIGSSLFILTSTPAFAGDYKKSTEKSMADEVAQIQTVETNTQSSNQARLTVQMNEDVRGAIARGDKVLVVDNNGNAFLNRYIAYDDLAPVSLSVDVVDTYEFEHNGRVYTNRIVEE